MKRAVTVLIINKNVSLRLVFFGIALFIVFIYICWMIPSFITALSTEPPLPFGIKTDADLLKDNLYYNHDYFVVYNQNIKISVHMESVYSLFGYVGGQNPTFKVTAPYQETISATSVKKFWADSFEVNDVDAKYSYAHPSLSVDLYISQKYYGQWITATADLDIVYPERSMNVTDEKKDEIYFNNIQKHLSREVRLFVISENDQDAVENHTAWKNARDSVATRNKIVVLLLIAVYITYRLKRRSLTRNDSKVSDREFQRWIKKARKGCDKFAGKYKV